MKAEGYQLTEVVEAGDLLRAAIADCHGMLDHQNWETSAAAWCTMQWVTDCRSLVATLEKPIMKNTDKRLGIELASLRQYLWRRRGNDKPDRRMLEELLNSTSVPSIAAGWTPQLWSRTALRSS